MTRAAREAFRQRAQRTREAELHPVTIYLLLDEQRTSPIRAAGEEGALGWRPTDAGRAIRQQSLTVHVRSELLPDWATQDDMTLRGRVELEELVFKISEILVQPHTWRITAMRWPSPED